MQNLLDAITVALQHDDDIEQLITKSAIAHEEVDGFIDVIQSLNQTLIPIQPSAKFANQLHSELMGTRVGVVKRVRQMPAHVHLAAILTVVAGFVLIGLRRILGSTTTQERHEEAVTV